MTAVTTRRATPRIFFSVGEPSGDLHGANLIRALRRSHPDIQCEGFGGDRMEAAGFDLHYPLCSNPLIGLFQVLRHVPQMARLLNRATEHFQRQKPDAVVLIDYPGFNWWVAKRAKEAGIPVFYFVPPQIWGWASWRVRKMKRFVDHVLCTLPFERPWYGERGIDAPYIGHPYFDALHEQKLDPAFLASQQARPERIVGILPGSRGSEIRNNFATQMRAAAEIHRKQPDTRFLVACYKQHQAEHCARTLRELFPGEGNGWSLPVELYVGRTPEVIHLSHSVIAVSGSVSLELLFACKPTVVLYRATRLHCMFFRLLRNVNYISLVNLLAERLIYPEYITSHCPSPSIAENILHWLTDNVAHQEVCRNLEALREEVAEPGACDRAARYLLNAIGASHVIQAA